MTMSDETMTIEDADDRWEKHLTHRCLWSVGSLLIKSQPMNWTVLCCTKMQRIAQKYIAPFDPTMLDFCAKYHWVPLRKWLQSLYSTSLNCIWLCCLVLDYVCCSNIVLLFVALCCDVFFVVLPCAALRCPVLQWADKIRTILLHSRGPTLCTLNCYCYCTLTSQLQCNTQQLDQTKVNATKSRKVYCNVSLAVH